MKFIIEPINDTDCRIVNIDCSDLQGQTVTEVTVPAAVEQDGKTWRVKVVGTPATFTTHENFMGKTETYATCSPAIFHACKKGDPAKFASLRNLKKIVFSEGIEAIHNIMNHLSTNADERGNAETLAEVVLPSTLKEIGAKAFERCQALTAVNIPDGLEVLGMEAFALCSSLQPFPWPKSLRKMDISAFYEMAQPAEDSPVNTLVIPDTIEEITGSAYGVHIGYKQCIVSSKTWPALDASNLPTLIENLEIPEGVTKVTGRYLRLRSVKLPSTLEEIGANTFERTDLDCLTELPSSLRIIGENAFFRAFHENGHELRITSPDITIGKDAFYCGSTHIKLTITNPAAMSAIMRQPGALNGTLVEAIDIPEGATEVEINDCPELTRLTIPSSVKRIIEISECPKLTELLIPDSVEFIGKFEKLPGLKVLQLPAQLKQPEPVAEGRQPDFLILRKLNAEIKASTEMWKLLCGVGHIENYGYEGVLAIPEGVEEIGNEFIENAEVSAISLPSSLKKIGGLAFNNCSKITAITIPADIEELRPNTFYRCKSLETIEFTPGSKLKKVMFGAFRETGVKNVTFPEGMTSIETEAFKDCPAIENITFPASMAEYASAKSGMSTIGQVNGCKSLKYVAFLADDPATAVYPKALGKKVDWYVPDNMVDHVKALLADNQSDAKAVKPLSKLTGAKPAAKSGATVADAPATKKEAATPKKKAPAKKKDVELTQPVNLYSKLKVTYRFPIDEADMPMATSRLRSDRAILAARYIREKQNECSVIFDTMWDSYCIRNEKDAIDFDAKKVKKGTIELNFADPDSLPAEFPEALLPALQKEGSFQGAFAAQYPGYKKELPADCNYLQLQFTIKVRFDFMIGEKEKFMYGKLRFLPGWMAKEPNCWRFQLIYNGRYIPATSIEGISANNLFDFDFTTEKIFVDGKRIEEGDDDDIADTNFRITEYVDPTLPFFNEILQFVK